MGALNLYGGLGRKNSGNELSIITTGSISYFVQRIGSLCILGHPAAVY